MNDPIMVLIVGAVLGLVLGLLGGGGGILAVPLLVALGEPIIVASTMSLVIVGVGAAAALVPHHRAGRVDWRIGITFGLLGSAGAIVGARIAPLVSPMVILAGLLVLLVIGASLMLRSSRRSWRGPMPVQPTTSHADGTSIIDRSMTPPTPPVSWPKTVILASAVGLVTGVFGVGAGFVVVPALTAAMHVPVRRATATALVVIVLNCLVALGARHDHMGPLDLTVALAAVTAVFAVSGAYLSHLFPTWLLSASFGTLMIAVAIYTVIGIVTA